MRRLGPALAILVILLAFASSATGAARFYASDYGSEPGQPETIQVFDRNPDGSLTPIPGSPFAAYPGPPFTLGGLIGIAFAPGGDRAVGSFLSKGGIQGYAVNGAGAITPTTSITTNQTENVAVTPDGRFAYIATREYPPGSGTQGIRAFALGADGSLVPNGSFETGVSFGGETAITPDGRFLYALAGGWIKRFAVAADGSLTPLGTTMSGGAGQFVMDPGGRFLFGGIASGPGGVISFAIGADGALTPVGEPALTGGGSATDVFSVSPDGSYLYVPDYNENKIAIVSVSPTGAVQMVGSMPASGVESTSVSPDNRFVYWYHGGGDYSIRVAAIGAGGGLTPLPFSYPYDVTVSTHFLFQPGPAPVAEFSAKAAAPNAAASFNAVKSANAAVYDWDFGDGTTLANGGPKPTHAYAEPGKYTVTLSLTDAQGCGAKQIYTGQSTTCPGGTATIKSVIVDTLPVIGKVKATPKKFLPAGVAKGKSGTKLRVKLNEAAKIGVKIEQRLPGREVGRKCKKPTPGNASKKRCSRFVKLGSRNLKNGKPGWNEIAFNGKLKGKPLAPGGYRVTAVATDSAKGRSAPKTGAFRVLPY